MGWARLGSMLVVMCLAGAVTGWADTCSYSYHCSSSACAELMGGWSGTLSQSGVTREQCEQVRMQQIPGGSSPCTCTSGDSGSTGGATGDVQMATGHNLQQNLVSLGANAMIMNIKNPYMSTFMSHATNSFLQTLFDNQQQADQQRQLMEQQLAEQRRQEEERRRREQQERLDAMFARLNHALKLEGVPFGLSLKTMTLNTDLQLKEMNSADPSGLKLKMSDSTPTSYGLKGLPGIYVGGPAGGDEQGSARGAGNPNVASGPGTGTTGPGIPGLPGIYLDNVQPSQAPQLAQAAEKLSGPERDLAQDAALQAAQQNPVLNGASQDPGVQSFQQNVQEYSQAAAVSKDAQQQLSEAQGRVATDHSVLDMAKGKLDGANATPAQQAAYSQMVQAAKTDEDAAVAAQKIFDNANATLSISRVKAATSLAALTPASFGSANVVDLSHAQSAVPMNLKTGTGSPVPMRVTPLPVRAAPAAPLVARAAPMDLRACLADAGGHTLPVKAALPTPEQLRQQVKDAQEAIRKLVESHEKEDALREEAEEQVKDAVHDAKKQAFDLTVDYVLEKAQAGARLGKWKADGELGELEKAAAGEKDAARLAQLQGQMDQAAARQENFKQAMEVLATTKDRIEEQERLRDFGEWVNSDPKELKQAQGYLEGVKQLVQAALAEDKVKAALRFTPEINSGVKWGSSLIDTSYDLLEEYFSARQLDQLNNNSTQYLKALAALNQRVKASVQELNCY